MTFNTTDNLCFLDSLVQLVACAFPTFDISAPSKSHKAGDESAALKEFISVVDSVRAQSEDVKIEHLGQLLSEICPGIEVGEHGDPSECWAMLISSMEEYIDMSCFELKEKSQSRCCSCDMRSNGGDDVVRGIICKLGGLTKRCTVDELLQNELQGKTETLQDYYCRNPECTNFLDRKKYKEEIKALQDKGNHDQEIEVLRSKAKDFQGERITYLEGTPSMLLVELSRHLPSLSKSKRHVELEVNRDYRINDNTYSLVGIARHYGTGLNSGHWTTVVKGVSGVWFEYEQTSKKEVAVGQVSSKEAVHLVFKKQESH